MSIMPNYNIIDTKITAFRTKNLKLSLTATLSSISSSLKPAELTVLNWVSNYPTSNL